MGTLYILESIYDTEKIYKIGITKRAVEKRIKELKTGNAELISCIFEYKSDNYTKIESTLHRLYGHTRVLGEWFVLNRLELEKVKDSCLSIDNNLKILQESNNKFI